MYLLYIALTILIVAKIEDTIDNTSKETTNRELKHSLIMPTAILA